MEKYPFVHDWNEFLLQSKQNQVQGTGSLLQSTISNLERETMNENNRLDYSNYPGEYFKTFSKMKFRRQDIKCK